MGRLKTLRLVLVLLSLSVGACSSVADKTVQPAKPVPSILVASVTPRELPPSRYGNPVSYEVFGRKYQVQTTSQGYQQRGVASWYGPKFHGKRTSSGTPYDMHQLTAAHKSLPIPTFVQVTRLDNGRSIIVKVNDRGPFVDDRLIDLSYAAAKQLNMLGPGTAAVEVKALPPYQYLARHQGPRVETRRVAAQTPAVPARPATAKPTLAKPTPVVTVAKPYSVVSAPSATAVTALESRQPSPPAPVVAEPLLLLPSEPLRQAEPLVAAHQAAATWALDSAAAASPLAGKVYLQAGAFAQRSSAERLQVLLSQSLAWGVLVDSAADQMHRVRIGPLQEDSREISNVKLALAQLGIQNAYLVKPVQHSN